jgi:carbonic anhydrase
VFVLDFLWSVFFILHNNFKHPVRFIKEKRFDEEAIRISLNNQVTFLNRGSLQEMFNSFPNKSSIIVDASHTDYIDADVLGVIRDFKDSMAPQRDISVSLLGFKACYDLEDQILYNDCATSDMQQNLSPTQILQTFKDGNLRVREGKCLKRDLTSQIEATSQGQYPLAVLSLHVP